MTLTTITIGAADYVSNSSVAEADNFLAVDPVRATAWAALDVDGKGAKLVAATRRLNPLLWMGEKTNGEGTQPDAWPRTNVTYLDGTAVSTTEVPIEVDQATMLLAGSIAINATVSQTATSGSNTKRLKAGSAEVEYFKATSGKALQDETAWALVKQFMGRVTSNSVGATAPGSSGVETSSFLDDQQGFGLTKGFS
jgi:hypothetical protein